jgi:uncharacterized protein YbbC (DUF1343 family)
MAIYARMMLGSGTLDRGDQPIQILSPQSVETMTTPYPVSKGSRGLGWDHQSAYSINRGNRLSARAYGHGGFTGTVLWIDPELDLFFLFLSNRVHPGGDGNVNALSGKIVDIVVSALADPAGPTSDGVRTGIDVLVTQNFQDLANQRVGLITNHTGRDVHGRSTASIFAEAPNVNLTALFSPEHGIEGKLDIPKIDSSQDAKIGIPIHSLYGATRRPTPEMLADVDTLVFDIQDIGSRFYTYISTMGEAMEAAAEANKRFIVLDRPNPLGGRAVHGPMLDPGKESFVGYHRLPVQHGMTIGEIAKLIQSERKLPLKLTVVPMEGWVREAAWDATGLTWVNPSPNMRSLTQAFLYPGVGLLEMTNLSVGRGTDTPFEVVGAPWIDARQWARTLNARESAGVRFVPISFTPDASRYKDQLCHGVNPVVTDRDAFSPVDLGLELAATLHQLYPSQWETENLNRLLASDAVRDCILRGAGREATKAATLEGLSEFMAKRQQVLLYP